MKPENQASTVQKEVQKAAQKKVKQEPAYTKQEILAAAHTFGVSTDIMAGALRKVDKDQLSRSDVEKAVQEFTKRKV